MRYMLAALALAACASESPQRPSCELGRSAACTCSSGGAGAQECGPSGVWSPCVCAVPTDAGSDVAVADGAPVDAAPAVDAPDASDAAVDAPADVVLVDGASAPRLYTACDLGADCGPGLACVAVPGLVRDAGAGRGVCTTVCTASSECTGQTPWRARCVMGACFVDCAGPRDADAVCAPWGTTCQVSTARIPETELPAGTPQTFYCAPAPL